MSRILPPNERGPTSPVAYRPSPTKLGIHPPIHLRSTPSKLTSHLAGQPSPLLSARAFWRARQSPRRRRAARSPVAAEQLAAPVAAAPLAAPATAVLLVAPGDYQRRRRSRPRRPLEKLHLRLGLVLVDFWCSVECLCALCACLFGQQFVRLC